LSGLPGLIEPVHGATLPVVGVWSSACGSFNLTTSSCPTGSLNVGNTISVQINVTNSRPYNAFETALYYDPSFLSATSIDLNTNTVWTNVFAVVTDTTSQPGAVFIGMTNLAATPITRDGILANVEFRIKALGVSPLSLAAGTAYPSGGATSLSSVKPDWTRLVYGGTPYDTSTADGYFMNQATRLGPVASFTYSPAQPVNGQSVSFNASGSFDADNPAAGSASIARYIWDFGDGSAGIYATIVQHTFGSQGNFSVRLTVVDSDDTFQGMVTHRVEVFSLSTITCPTAAILLVPGDCSTIQSALNSVSAGGTVNVSAGTYKEDPVVEKPVSLIGSGMTILYGSVKILHAVNATVSGFTILNAAPAATTGVEIASSQNVTASNNEIVGQAPTLFQESHGIEVSGSRDVSLIGNTVLNETIGISLQSTSDTTLRSNTMTRNDFNFGITGSYVQNIDASNTIDGKPMFYDVNGNNPNPPANPGYVAIVNSRDVVVGHTSISNEEEGVLIVNSTRVTISGVEVHNAIYGAIILNSTSTTVTGSTLEGGNTGLRMDFGLANSILNDTFSGGSFIGGISVDIESSSRNLIENNQAAGGYVELAGSAMNQIVNNQATAIILAESPNNEVTSNRVVDIYIQNSPNNLLRSNQIEALDGIGIAVFSGHIQCIFSNTPCVLVSDYVQDIDSSNTVSGKPIYYLVNKDSVTVPSNAGFVAVVNSTNIVISQVNIAYNYEDVVIVSSTDVTLEYSNLTYALRAGVFAWSTRGLVLQDNSFLGDYTGINVESSNSGVIVGNVVLGYGGFRGGRGIVLSDASHFDIEGNYVSYFFYGGIVFRDFTTFNGSPSGSPSSNNIIDRNTVVSASGPSSDFSSAGIFASPNSTVSGNTIAYNHWGLATGGNDTIYQNNFINNDIQGRGSQDRWDNGSGQGNYWSDYTGQDTDGDGVGDTLLPHLGLDNYPLVSPWTPTGLAAKLTGRSAWPQYKRLSLSRVSSGIQTLFALANNTGTAPEWIEAVFNVTSATGATIQIVSGPVWVAPGGQIDLSTSFSPLPGSYKVTVTLRFSSDAYLSWKTGSVRTFSFQVVS
jgi:parallel beta-helix repeat protein